MASRVLRAIGEIAVHLPEVRRNPLGALDLIAGSDAVRAIRDLPYGPHGGQRVDLYLPASEPVGPRAAVVFFHGGRWSYGRKEEYRFVAQAFGSLGYAVAVCDYRKYPSVRFPSFVEDGAAAIAWALGHLPRHGIDPRLIFVMGHSAGAHLASLATMDRRYSEVHGVDPDSVAGLVLLSGPFDFFPIRGDDLRDIFGPEQNHAETQPLRFVRRGLPPMLFLHGRRDQTVRPVSSARMASAIREQGGQARAVFYDSLTHTNILAALSGRIGFLFAPVLDDVAGFLKRRIVQLTAAPAARAQEQPER
ncbi:MAG: alpha/beta hydrolase [Candidatus Binatia bacterium]